MQPEDQMAQTAMAAMAERGALIASSHHPHLLHALLLRVHHRGRSAHNFAHRRWQARRPLARRVHHAMSARDAL